MVDQQRISWRSADSGPTGPRAPARAPSAPGPVDPLDVWSAAKGTRRSPRSLPRLLKDAVRLVRRAGGHVFELVLGLQVLTALLAGATVLIGQRALQAVLDVEAGDSAAAAAFPALLALAVVFAGASLVTSVVSQVQRLLGELVLRATWDRLLDVTTSVDLLSFERPDFHEHQQRVQISALRRPLTVTDGLAALASGAAGVVVISLALLSIAPEVVPVMLIGAPSLWLVTRRSARLEFAFVLDTTPTLRERVYLRDVLSQRAEAQEVRAYGSAPSLRAWHDEKYDSYLTDLRRLVRRRTQIALLGAGVTVPVILATFGVLLWLVSSGRTSLAGAGAAAVAIRLLGSRIDQLTKGAAGLYESSLFLADLESFVERGAAESAPPAPEAPPVPTASRRTGAGGGRRSFHSVELQGVDFSYPGGSEPALQEIDLTVKAGEVVGLVGENGSGKSTLAKVLAQLYAPTHGSVLWDGELVRPQDRDQLRDGLAVVFQDFARYRLSGQSNICLGPPGPADARRVTAAARQARAHDRLRRLPAGYDTVLSTAFKGGVDLSGGEWQRVALARALFRDAPFVLLDEPTAALDPRAEHELFEDLRRMLTGRAVVLISHRLSSVVSADRIHVLDAGRIVETGTHRTLLRRKGLYADLFGMQAAAYRLAKSERAS